MAVTLEEISEWLEQQEYNFGLEEDKIVLITSGEDSQSLHRIRAKDDGRIFEWNMVIVDETTALKVKEHKHLQTLLVYLLQMNYTTKFGTWEYDPTDGEIAFNIEIPLEDAVMTFKQFERICSMTMNTETQTNNIKKILETGEMPKDDEDERLAILEELLAKLMTQAAEEETAADEEGI